MTCLHSLKHDIVITKQALVAGLFSLLWLTVASQSAAQQEPPPPPPPTTEFGNLTIRQNDSLNTSTSVTMFRGPGSTLKWEPVWLSSNRGDFALTFFRENDFEAGTVISSVTQNGRDNRGFGDTFGPFRATVAVAASPETANSQPTSYFLATSGAYVPPSGENGGEVNVNLAFGYFPYNLWIAGNAWIFSRANGARVDRLTGTPGLTLGTHLTNPSNGVYELDLRSFAADATSTNGILLVNHAKNEDNYGASTANANGTFTLRVKDNGSSGTGTEQDPVTFVYVPQNRVGQDHLLAMGRVRNNGSTAVKGGIYSVANVGTGIWHLTIPGQNPNTGTLLVSPGSSGNMADNLISYEWNSAGYWVVQAVDIVSATTLPVLENGGSAFEEIFSFAFFEAPQLPEVTVTSPTQGQTFTNPAAFTVRAEASDVNGSVAKVEFFRNNRLIAEITQPPYEITESNLVGGYYVYQARATDNEGLAPSSTPVSVRVSYDPLNVPDNTALFLDGLTEHARTLVVEPAFGVGGPPSKGLTLECWFRKEGMGATASSGSGGITVQPLLAKGRGESDNNTSDCNYLFGVTTDGLLAADFEAFPTTGVVVGGANFPIYGTHDPIQNGRWYHAAVTYDGVAGLWSLYLDGVLVGSRATVPGAMPRYDSQHGFAIGAAMNTLTQRAGSFFGAIDEVRVWDFVRSAQEIVATKNSTVVTAAGLVARFGLDEGQGKAITSSSGTAVEVFGPSLESGELPGVDTWTPLWIEGAPLENQAPLLTFTAPDEGDVFVGTTPFLLAAEATDTDGTIVKVEFFDGATSLAQKTAPPYEFLWAGASVGSHRLRAVVEDDDGAVTVEAINIEVRAPSSLLLTEVQSSQTSNAPSGVADYWELTNFGSSTISLAGYTWDDSRRNRTSALAWALPAGTSIAPGESLVFTTANVASFRAWWGLAESVRVIQSVGAPGLGQNDGVALYDAAGAEVFYFNYGPGGFTQASGLPSLGGHAGSSGGGTASDALLWQPSSGLAAPRYAAARVGVNGAITAVNGGDLGSPGTTPGNGIDPPVLLSLQVAPALFAETAVNPAAVGTLKRFGDVSTDLVVALVSGDLSEAVVPASITIPAGQSSVSFDVTAVDDILADGNQQVMIAATAAGTSLATFGVTVTDDGDLPPPALLLTEVQSNQSGTAAAGAADYFEITNHGTVAVNLAGFTWSNISRSYAAGQAWAFPVGTSIAAGESVVVTTADPTAFREWWGIGTTVQVLQTVGAPELGADDGVALFDNNGRELFFFSYATGGFKLPNGGSSAGGQAGVSGGGVVADALVWEPRSGVVAPRYVAADVGVLNAFKAATGTDVGSPGSGAAQASNQFTLQLLHFADQEPGVSALDRAPLLAAMTEAYAAEYNHTLILAGGDSFIPGAFLNAGSDPALDAVVSVGKTALGRPEMALLNLIGVDASAIGVHEWDLGSEVFTSAVQADGTWVGAQFPFLAANLAFTGDSAANARFSSVPFDGTTSLVPLAGALKGRLAPVTVVEKGGERIGLIGVTTQLLAHLSEPSGTVVAGTTGQNLTLLAAQVQAWLDELQDEGVNKTVLLSHLRDPVLEQELATKLRGVDVILAAGVPGYAGDYPVVTQDQLGEPLLIVSTGGELSQLGRLVMDFDLDGRLIVENLPNHAGENGLQAVTPANVAAAWNVTPETLSGTAFAPGTKGAAVTELTNAVRAVWTLKESNVKGFTAVHLEGGTAVGHQETNLGNLVADAHLARLRAVVGGETTALVSLVHAGSLRTPIGAVTDDLANGIRKRPPLGALSFNKPAGAVSQLDIESTLRLNHGLMTFETTAQGLKNLLEHGVAAWPNRTRFPQVGGVQFAWDPARPAGDRVTSISLLQADGRAGAPLYKIGPLAQALLDKAPTVIRVVTLNALANNGEGYPAKANGDRFRYLLSDNTLGPVLSESLDFTAVPQVPANALQEQSALAAFFQANYGNLALAYRTFDSDEALDARIQNLRFRSDTVPPLSGTDSDGDGLDDLTEIVMGGNPFASLRVGDFLDLDLSVWLTAGQTARISGRLPGGLRFDPVTRRLTGIITGLDGFYDLQLQILAGRTVVGAVALPLAVGAFPARLLAGYEALLERPDGTPIGIARLAVSRAGSWSGNVTLAGQARRSASGTFALLPGEQKAELVLTFKATKVLPEFRVTLNLDAGSAVVDGTWTDGGLTTGQARGFRLADAGASPPLVQRLNLALDAGPQDGVIYPAGIGWARGTINKSGAISVTGQLGDAQAATFAMRLGANGQALVWLQPYRNKVSYFGGVLDLPDLGQAQPQPQKLVPGALWFKAADPREKAYADGFPVALEVTGLSRGFAPVRSSGELLAQFGSTDPEFGLEIEGGGLSSSPASLPLLPSSLNLLANFSLTVAGPANAAPWSGRLGNSDGSLTGTLTLPAGLSNLAGKAAVTGVLLPGVPDLFGVGLIRVPVGAGGVFRTASVILLP
jgi:2',3'-cyclic-nucleotide 2'-phosphodiesterase (5'-nucleotidase family)